MNARVIAQTQTHANTHQAGVERRGAGRDMCALLEHAHAATGLRETEREAAADDARADDNDIDVDNLRHIRERVCHE